MLNQLSESQIASLLMQAYSESEWFQRQCPAIVNRLVITCVSYVCGANNHAVEVNADIVAHDAANMSGDLTARIFMDGQRYRCVIDHAQISHHRPIHNISHDIRQYSWVNSFDPLVCNQNVGSREIREALLTLPPDSLGRIRELMQNTPIINPARLSAQVLVDRRLMRDAFIGPMPMMHSNYLVGVRIRPVNIVLDDSISQPLPQITAESTHEEIGDAVLDSHHEDERNIWGSELEHDNISVDAKPKKKQTWEEFQKSSTDTIKNSKLAAEWRINERKRLGVPEDTEGMG